MATQALALEGGVVYGLKDSLSLSDGVAYLVQLILGDRVLIAEAASAPSLGDPAHYLDKVALVEPQDGSDIYVWSTDPARVVITERETIS